MGMVMRISDHVVVLNFGRLIARGAARRGPAGPGRSIDAYLGAAE